MKGISAINQPTQPFTSRLPYPKLLLKTKSHLQAQVYPFIPIIIHPKSIQVLFLHNIRFIELY